MKIRPTCPWFSQAISTGVGALLLAMVLTGCVSGNEVEQGVRAPEMRTLTNRVDFISDGNALIEIVIPSSELPSDMIVTLNGRDVSAVFAKRPDGRVTGVLTDLSIGENMVIAALPGVASSQLQITKAPRSGPVFAGPFPAPHYFCATPTRTDAGLIVPCIVRIAKHPQIDLRSYEDSLIDAMPGAFATGAHAIWRSYSLRDRLDHDAGGHGNHVMWRFGRTGLLTPPGLSAAAFEVMNERLAELFADHGTAAIETRISRARPEEAIDFCLLSSDETQSIKVMDEALCDADPYLAPSASPRQIAGGDRTEDILKCQLRPLDRGDYGGRLPESQFERLRAILGRGVCDWAKPGVGQQPAHERMMTFDQGPGGVALGPPPQSSSL